MELNECEGEEIALTGKGCRGYGGFYEEPDKKTDGKDLDNLIILIFFNSVPILAFSCYVATYHALSDLKQHTFVVSSFT